MILDTIHILHCTVGNSDKVYILELLECPAPYMGKFTLVTTWGRRTALRLSSQIKIEREPRWAAMEELQKLSKQKLKGGYKHIKFDINLGEPEGISIPGYRREFESSDKSAFTATIKTPLTTPAEGSLTRGMV